eukprot:4984041-Lingulodinium_polyedra.AAC.1
MAPAPPQGEPGGWRQGQGALRPRLSAATRHLRCNAAATASQLSRPLCRRRSQASCCLPAL